MTRTCKPYEFFNRSTGHTIYGIDAPAGEISWAPLFGSGKRLLYKQAEERDAELNRINKALLSVDLSPEALGKGETAQAGKAMPEFTVALTDEQAESLRQIAAYRHETLEEALDNAVREGMDMAMMEKANDEHHAETITRQYGPSGDVDDDIPF